MNDYQTLVTALKTLAAVCDYASSDDGMGFNGRDAQFGHSLAEQSMSRTLSPNQQTAAIKMLQTYRGQLQRAGIELPTISQYQVYQNGNAQPKPIQPPSPVKITLEKGSLVISFPYDPKLVELVKSLPERKFNGTNKTWTAPSRLANEVLAKFPGATVDPAVLELVAKSQQLASMSNRASSDFNVAGLGGEMMPFQRAGVQFAETANGRAIIADQMGLGKTIQALAYLQLHPELRPAVIVVPASLKINWKRESDKWLTAGKTIEILAGTKADTIPQADIYIINYDVLHAWVDTLLSIKPQIMIADEAHYAKNAKSRRAKTLKQLAGKINRVILLTGTPVTNRPLELFPLLNMVDPKAWPSFFPFAKRYCNAYHNGYGWDFHGAANLSELHEKIKPYVVRRTKEQVLKELPAKRRVALPMEMSKADRKEYDRLIDEATGAIEATRDAGGHLGAEHLALIEKSKQSAVRGKLPVALDWIEDFIESDKLIVFATHTFVVDALMERFGKVAVKVTGEDSQQQRQTAVDRFQNDEAVRLFVGNIKAAGVGLTLTAASDVAFLEYAWEPGSHTQAEDRAHRIGQRDSVTAWYLIAEGTIDETIVRLLESKAQVVDAITDGKEYTDFSILHELADSIIIDSKKHK